MLASSRRAALLKHCGQQAEGGGSRVNSKFRGGERSEKTRLNFEKKVSLLLVGFISPASPTCPPPISPSCALEESPRLGLPGSHVGGQDRPFKPNSVLGSVLSDSVRRIPQTKWHHGSQSGGGLYHFLQKYWKLKRNDWGELVFSSFAVSLTPPQSVGCV